MTRSSADRGTLAALRGGLIVSCQAAGDEPLANPDVLSRMARAVVDGGAAAVRIEGPENIVATASAVNVPIIGLWKSGREGVYITPSLRHAQQVLRSGADIIAVDGTRRERPDGLTLRSTVSALKEEAQVLVMADCGSLGDAENAILAGADIVGTTLAGYTSERPGHAGPDFELLSELIEALPNHPVIAEGRIWTPSEAREAIDIGAWAVCVGSAITRPTLITERYVQAIQD